MFAITRFHNIEVVFHVFYYFGAKNIVRYDKDVVVQRFVISRFHCSTANHVVQHFICSIVFPRALTRPLTICRNIPAGDQSYVITISGSVDTLLYHQVLGSFLVSSEKKIIRFPYIFLVLSRASDASETPIKAFELSFQLLVDLVAMQRLAWNLWQPTKDKACDYSTQLLCCKMPLKHARKYRILRK